MPDTPTPPETSVSTWSDIESIRANFLPCPECGGNGWYAQQISEDTTNVEQVQCQMCNATGRLYDGTVVDSLFSALAIAREETLEECAKIVETGATIENADWSHMASIIRSLSHTQKPNSHEKN